MQGICRVILIAFVWEINQHLSTSVDVIHETGNFILCKELKETYGIKVVKPILKVTIAMV